MIEFNDFNDCIVVCIMVALNIKATSVGGEGASSVTVLDQR